MNGRVNRNTRARRGRRASAGDRRMLLRRVLLIGAAAFFLCILQCSFFSRIKPFGATPDLMLGAVIATMMLDNKRSAAVLALGGGFLVDSIGGLTPAFSPVFYLLTVALMGLLSDMMEPRFISFGAILLPSAVLRGVYTFLCVWGNYGALPPVGDLFGIILPEMLSTAVFCLPVYFLIKLVLLPIDDAGKT